MAGWRAVLVCIAAAFFAFFYDSTVAENVFYGVLGSLVVAVFIDLGNTRSDRIEKERLREQANLDFKEKCGSIPFMLWDLTGHPVGEKAYVDKMIIELFRYDSEPYSSGFFHVAAGVSFDITKPILWASSAIAAGATGTNNYLALQTLNLRNNLAGITMTQYPGLLCRRYDQAWHQRSGHAPEGSQGRLGHYPPGEADRLQRG